jgi:hypothetical protein
MRLFYRAWLICMLFSVQGFSYRFICNGLSATGETRQDQCGICDVEHAPRWADPVISVVVDETKLPRTITQSEWQKAVKNSFAAWESISGSSLRFVQKGETANRDLGANDATHEIFWITDKEEWRKLVGSGEFGTLGATLPRYICGGPLGSKRQIFDADMALNGLPHINWQTDCDDEDCVSVLATLIHELGHVFGLDHPCLQCNTSIMSARAGSDLIYPVIDDMEGLRALYPNGEEGGFGSPCKNNDDCSENNFCLRDRLYRYCSQDCESDSECLLGAVCKKKNSFKVCHLKSSDIGPKDERENCMHTPCKEPLVCAGASEPNFYCYQPCQAGHNCKANQECIDLPGGSSICVAIRKLNARCDHRDLCGENLFCVFDKLKSGICRAPCLPTTTADSGCPAGEVCEIIEGVELCTPKTDELVLDESLDEFRGVDELFPAKTASPRTTISSGCYSLQNQANHHGLLGFILLWLALKWARPRFSIKALKIWAKS